jgi:hypothetical protein
MSHRALRARIVVAAGAAITACSAVAEVVVFAGGPYVPPPVIGPYMMTRFAPDTRPHVGWTPVVDVPSPLGGQLEFSVPLDHRRLGYGWDGWGSGYPAGDVYFCAGSYVRMILPENTRAFHFSGDFLGDVRAFMRATTDNGTGITQMIDSYGRGHHFGFYVTDPDDPPIRWIDVQTLPNQFVVGEFGIAIPEPATLGLLALGAPFLRRGR